MQAKGRTTPPVLAIVIPCFNEEAVIGETISKILQKLVSMKAEKLISARSFLCFSDDGSKDKTWEILSESHAKNPGKISLIKLTRNFGHQAALLAGLQSVSDRCDCSISLDADLQDDIEKLDEFVKLFLAGNEIIFGVRNDRTVDSVFKRQTAQIFYSMQSIFGLRIVRNHADYRLLGSKAMAALNAYGEANLFLRGIVAQLGFQTAVVYYQRNARFAGETKYPFRKMMAFALDGISSFSILPMRLLFFAGGLTCVLSFLAILWILAGQFFFNRVVSGWSSLMVSIFFLGGVQLLGLGILGEYVGKTYLEVKRRPRFLIEEHLRNKK